MANCWRVEVMYINNSWYYWRWNFLYYCSFIYHVVCFFYSQSWRALFVQTITSARNLLIVLGHWLLHAYGIVALAVYTEKNEAPLLSISLLPILTLVPLPTILYVLLARFTDPTKFHSDWRIHWSIYVDTKNGSVEDFYNDCAQLVFKRASPGSWKEHEEKIILMKGSTPPPDTGRWNVFL